MIRKRKILLIIEQCNPDWSSVPLEGYHYYQAISQHNDVTLITHERNKAALEKTHPDGNIVYIHESKAIRQYYSIASRLSKRGKRVIWPLYNTLTYPIYAEFNHQVYQQFQRQVKQGTYDLVHAITPMMPRYPVNLIQACVEADIPFVIGPVNGGVPFPKGFQDIAHQEFAYFNFLRLIGRYMIPGYHKTYEQATQILAGSSYTLDLLKKLFRIDDDQIRLFYENGIRQTFLKDISSGLAGRDLDGRTIGADGAERLELLFVGRLVPYKGADMVIEALHTLAPDIQNTIRLTIVGDGSERTVLEGRVRTHHLTDKVQFTGWVSQRETCQYYRRSHIFCFPSVREFGGAVVLEAMANGLPCIVVNNGGIGEYVTEDTGFSIEPYSREYVIQMLKQHIEELARDNRKLQQMSAQAIERAREFTWEVKGDQISSIYDDILRSRVPPVQLDALV